MVRRRNGFFRARMGFFRFFQCMSGIGTDRCPKLFRPKKRRQEAISSTRFQRNRAFSSRAKIPSDGGEFAAGGDQPRSARIPKTAAARRRHALQLRLGTPSRPGAFGVLPRYVASCCARWLGVRVELQRARLFFSHSFLVLHFKHVWNAMPACLRSII